MFERFDIPKENTRERELSPIELEMRFNMERTMMHRFLIERGVSPDDDIAPLLHEWENQYLDTFRQVVEEMQEQDPGLLAEWQDHPEAVANELESRLKARHAPDQFRKAA